VAAEAAVARDAAAAAAAVQYNYRAIVKKKHVERCEARPLLTGKLPGIM